MSTVEERVVGAADSKESGDCSPKIEELSEIKKLKIDNSSISKEKESKYDSEAESKYDSEAESFDEEEYNLWVHEMATSEGFDLTVSPHGVMGSVDIFNDPRKLTDAKRQKCDDYVKMAIEHFNKRENANLEFVNLLKVNISYGKGDMYYLTFEAKETKCGSVGPYQAQVWNTFKLCGPDEDEIQVLICRKKPEKKPDNSDLELEEKSWPCGCPWPCACEPFDLWA